MSHNVIIDLDRRTVEEREVTPRVSVVVPTFNEAANLPHVFALLPEDVYEVIIVDGKVHAKYRVDAEQLRAALRKRPWWRRLTGRA